MKDDIIAAVRKSMLERGFPPTIRELGKELGLGVATVHERLRELEKEGRIVRVIAGNVTRAIRIVED